MPIDGGNGSISRLAVQKQRSQTEGSLVCLSFGYVGVIVWTVSPVPHVKVVKERTHRTPENIDPPDWPIG